MTTKAAKIFCNKKNLLIPTGTTVWVPNYVLHNSNQNWDEARTFKPERWSSPDVQYSKGTKDKLRFTPFGQGIKGCIGQVRMCYLRVRGSMCRARQQLTDMSACGNLKHAIRCAST